MITIQEKEYNYDKEDVSIIFKKTKDGVLIELLDKEVDAYYEIEIDQNMITHFECKEINY